MRMSEQPSVVRNIFFYLIALVALGFIVGSSVNVLNYVAKVTVFTEGETSGRYLPPGLFLNQVKPGSETVSTKVTCSETCSLTESDRTSINDWQSAYKDWQNQPTASATKTRGLVNALSMLIVALPIFIFFFRTVQKDYRVESAAGQALQRATTVPRSIYFYFIVLAAVVMFIISAGATINTSLKTWVVKDAASDANQPIAMKSAPGAATSDTEGVETLLACVDKCAISAEQKTHLTQWQKDYADAKAEIDSQNTKSWQRTLALSIPFLLVSIPLFWLHWMIIQRERKKVTP